jgi:hypothetical protein
MANPATLRSLHHPTEHEGAHDDEINPPLTPPATDEQPNPRLDTFDIGEVMHLLRSCRDHPAIQSLQPLTTIELPRQGYDELVRKLQGDTVGQYIDHKVRYVVCGSRIRGVADREAV